jgi:hypothetical protein
MFGERLNAASLAFALPLLKRSGSNSSAQLRRMRIALRKDECYIPSFVHSRPTYPRRPFRAALIAFFSLCVLFAIYVPFDDKGVLSHWPHALGYCAFLAIATIGLVRLGRRVLWLIALPTLFALAPGLIGIALMLRSVDRGEVWLKTSSYLFYPLAAWGILLVLRGWWLYFFESADSSNHPSQESGATGG